MNPLIRLALALCLGYLLLAIVAAEPGHVKIAAFNIQVFGVTKAAKPEVMKYIVKIIQRYDLILIQEIRDKSQTAMYKLLSQLKEAGTPYRMHISKRLGRTSSKEQYAFLSRIDSGIAFEDAFIYDDGAETAGNDTFQREPYVVRFSFQNLPFQYISFIAIHADPGEAVAELQHLSDVHKAALKKWGNDEIIIMGDLNADCSYVPKKSWSKIPLRADSYFWPIEDSADTTIAGTNCAYDRFIISGEKLIKLAKEGKTSVFKFDAAYGIDNELSREISDHYPIELDLPITVTNEIPTSSSKSPTSFLQDPPIKFLLNRMQSILSSKWVQYSIDRIKSVVKLIL